MRRTLKRNSQIDLNFVQICSFLWDFPANQNLILPISLIPGEEDSRPGDILIPQKRSLTCAYPFVVVSLYVEFKRPLQLVNTDQYHW